MDTKGLKSNGVSISSNTPPDNIQDSISRLNIQDNQEGAGTHPNPYPSHTTEPDCMHYLRTGACGYGNNCRYNHPTFIEQGAQYRGELPERVGQPDCQYFLKTRTCKFGATCKYNHPRDIHDAPPVPLNILGLPMRQDEKSCPFYMRTGSCKFGILCKFNHPQPSTLGPAFPATGPTAYVFPGSSAPPSGLPLISGFAAWPLSRAPYMSSPRTQGVPAYMPIVLPPSQGTMPVRQGWTTYTGSTQSHARFTTDSPGVTQTSNSTNPQLGSTALVNLPEKPDQPECQYYMKTGNCKYGTSCKYHHPKERNSLAAIGPHGLPLRQGRAACTVYSMYGTCNYGSSCRFDHPLMGYYYNYSLPALSAPVDDHPTLLFPDQRNTQVTHKSAAAETPSLPADGLVKSDEMSNGGLQEDTDSTEHGDPSQQTTPSDTAPSESPHNRSD